MHTFFLDKNNMHTLYLLEPALTITCEYLLIIIYPFFQPTSSYLRIIWIAFNVVFCYQYGFKTMQRIFSRLISIAIC